VADLPFPLDESLAQRLRGAIDVEGKIVRALDALGPLADRRVGLLDVPPGPLLDDLRAARIDGTPLPLADPLALGVPDQSLDALVSLWSGFRGVDATSLAEADRALAPDGRLLVVHDYGRDEVSALVDPEAPQYRVWSHRDGPFLRGAGFRIRVLHCFWTFASIEEARSFLAEAFGDRGEAVGGMMKRPRLSWNVAVYHRWRGGVGPRAPGGRPGPATLPVVSSRSPAARRGAHLGPVRITPARVFLAIALLGGLGFLAYSLLFRDALQVPLMATGFAVCGIVFGIAAAMSVSAVMRAGREGRDGAAVLTSLVGGLLAIGAFMLLAAAVIMTLIWTGTTSA
jgi:hypothetical protein